MDIEELRKVGTLKSELFYLQKFNSIDELKRKIKEYI